MINACCELMLSVRGRCFFIVIINFENCKSVFGLIMLGMELAF